MGEGGQNADADVIVMQTAGTRPLCLCSVYGGIPRGFRQHQDLAQIARFVRDSPVAVKGARGNGTEDPSLLISCVSIFCLRRARVWNIHPHPTAKGRGFVRAPLPGSWGKGLP